MTRHNWKYIGKTEYATIKVDYSKKMTLITTNKGTRYYHKGIYPFHNPKGRRFK